MSIVLRAAHVNELEELTRIAHDAKRFWGYPEAWIDAWRDELTIHQEDLLSQEVFVAEDMHGHILGFAALRKDGTRGQLEHLWVAPSSMGKGVGRALFEQAIQRVQGMSCQSLEIDADPNATDFYRRMGAVQWGSVAAPMEGVDRQRPQLRLTLASSRNPRGPE